MIETSELTFCGLCAASVWAIIPPIEAPITCAGASPSWLSSPAASCAMSASVYWAAVRQRRRICAIEGGAPDTCVERPLSRLSKRTTCSPRAASSRQKSSGQATICVPSPMISSAVGLDSSPKVSKHRVTPRPTSQNCSDMIGRL